MCLIKKIFSESLKVIQYDSDKASKLNLERTERKSQHRKKFGCNNRKQCSLLFLDSNGSTLFQYFLFPKFNQKLKEQCFNTMSEIQKAFDQGNFRWKEEH